MAKLATKLVAIAIPAILFNLIIPPFCSSRETPTVTLICKPDNLSHKDH